MNKPMATEELFNRIQSILKEKGRLPDILDYGLATSRPVPVTICEYERVSKLTCAGSEGIYLDGVFCQRQDGKEETRYF